MNTRSHPCRFGALSVALLVVSVLLPYSGPGLCSVLGRMGHGTDMMGMAADVSVSAPGSAMECCSMTGCGVTYAGPVAYTLAPLSHVPTRALPVVSTLHRPLRTFPQPPPRPPQG